MLALLQTALAITPVADGPWEHVQVQTASLSVHTLQAGPADAPAVVLLHGFPDASYAWRDVIPELSRDHRVIAPDLRGYGGTDKPKKGYELDTLGNDVVELLDALGLDTVDLVGHDWGAAITWTAAYLAPERFSSITVLNVPHPTALWETWQENPAQREYKKFANLMTFALTPRILAGIDREDRGPDVYMPELVNDEVFDDAREDFYGELLNEVSETRPPLRYYKKNFNNWRKVWQRAEGFPDTTVPTLVLWGAQDSYMLVENAARSCEHVSARCEVATHPEAAHWLHWEQPSWVAEQWRAFTR